MFNKVSPEDFSIAKENKKDFKQSVIARSNLTNEFTIADIEKNQFDLDRLERELTAQVRVSTAAIDNVKRNHAFVSKMSDEQLAAASYLFETKELLQKSESNLKEVKAAKKNYKTILNAIYTKFGFVESNVMDNEKNGVTKEE